MARKRAKETGKKKKAKAARTPAAKPKAKAKTKAKAKRKPKTPQTAARLLLALQLRSAGASYEEIAAELGWANKGAAYKAVQAALAETLTEAAEHVKTLELRRLDALQRGIWPEALSGDPKAVMAAVKVLERRHKLLGIDAPVKAALTLETLAPVSMIEVFCQGAAVLETDAPAPLEIEVVTPLPAPAASDSPEQNPQPEADPTAPSPAPTQQPPPARPHLV